jgi:hypothetical protein
MLSDQAHNLIPHRGATPIHVTPRVSDDVRIFDRLAVFVVLVGAVRAKFKTAEHDARSFGHGGAHTGDIAFEAIERCADQDGIVHRRADFDSALSGKTTR